MGLNHSYLSYVVLCIVVFAIINLYCCSLSLYVVIGADHPVVEADPAIAERSALASVWAASPPVSHFERQYYNWFRVPPTFLYEVLIRETSLDVVRDTTINLGLRDPSLDYDSIDEDFYAAVVQVLD